MSSFGKIRVEGPDATAFMNHVGGGQYDVPVGKIVYTQFLNSRGGIEADVTVTRLSETAYLVVTPAATRLGRSDLDGTPCRRIQGRDHRCDARRRRAGGDGAKCAQPLAKGLSGGFLQ